MNIDTCSFAALTGRLDQLEAEVAGLRQTAPLRQTILDQVAADAYREGRESVLGAGAERRPLRPRHLRSVDGGQP